MHTIKLTQGMRSLLSEWQILPNFHDGSNDLARIRTLVFSPHLRVAQSTRHIVQNGTTMVLGSYGYMSYGHSPLHGAVTGAFCSLAGRISVMGHDHPIDRVSTHPVSYGPFYRRTIQAMGIADPAIVAPFNGVAKIVTILNDVWIGDDVKLAGGITIGTGAVIATGAIVTKDVDPYTIVGGIPARVIRHRFPPALRGALFRSRWWEYRLEDLARFSFEDPAAFCDAFMRERDSMVKREGGLLRAPDLLALA